MSWCATAAMPSTATWHPTPNTSHSSWGSRSATARSACGANNSRARIQTQTSGEAVDEPQRQRVEDDLKGLIKGELQFDELSRSLYSTDASIFQVRPLGVVVPRDEEDVQALVRYAAEHQLPLIARGAGTGVAGESLGTGIIIDLSRHFRSIVQMDEETVRVQPGVVYADLNQRLARHGRRFAPDPTSGVQCTIGGMLATNASGARALRYGYMRDYVVRLRAVF